MLPTSGSLNSTRTAYVVQPATAMLAHFGDQQLQYAPAMLPSGAYDGTVTHVAASAAHSPQFFGPQQNVPMSTSSVEYDQLHSIQPMHEQQGIAQYWQWYTNNRAVPGNGPFADWTPPFHEHLDPRMLLPYQPPVQQRAIDYARTAPAMTHTTAGRSARAWRRCVPHSSVDLVTMSTPDFLTFASTVAGAV